MGPNTRYTTLSLAEVRAELEDVVRDTQPTFGGFDLRQLNWRPDPTAWSIAQCLEHLVTANRLMFRAAEEALDDARPRTAWQRLPVLPAVLGRMMILSLAPGAPRKFTAPPQARPSTSEIPPGVIQRFAEQHRTAVQWLQGLDEGKAARAIMTSPFVRVITYSVLDGCRLVVAHDRRHFEQARRVMLSPGFPIS